MPGRVAPAVQTGLPAVQPLCVVRPDPLPGGGRGRPGGGESSSRGPPVHPPGQAACPSSGAVPAAVPGTTLPGGDPPRTRPPGIADERTQLLGWLDLQRALVPYKCAGLSDVDARRSLLPGSPAMTVAGLVSHLRWVEHCWFQVLFLDRGRRANPQFGDVPDADFQVDGIPLPRLLEEYAHECAASDAVVAAASLDDRGRNREHGADSLSLRWILGHMVEEVARHVGHLDLLREMADGEKSYY